VRTHALGNLVAMGAALSACERPPAVPPSVRYAGAEFGIRYHGDPILETPCLRLASLEELPVGLVPAMQRIMGEWRHGFPPGVGIAAPQVGAALAVAIVTIDRIATVMLNPRIIGRSEDTAYMREGCLSIPGFYTSVRRHLWVDVEWEDLAWTTHFRRVGAVKPAPLYPSGTPGAFLAHNERCEIARMHQFDARCVQHEVDHLVGKQITDDVPRPQRRAAERAVAKVVR
jgi:peptide deformylase